MQRTLVIAATDMIPGEEVKPEQLRAEERETGITAPGFAASSADLLGRLAKVRITAGTPLLVAQFEKANDVIRGATVKVEVREGAAVLLFDARADTSGRTGDSISVINPATNKSFKAKVVGKNSVLVSPVISQRAIAEVSQK
jgi:flagella basal body P-ring formation protein FlgA